jgi:putative transposase
MAPDPGFLYLVIVPGTLWVIFSRRIVGWAMASHLRTEFVFSAPDMALWNTHPNRSFQRRISNRAAP